MHSLPVEHLLYCTVILYLSIQYYFVCFVAYAETRNHSEKQIYTLITACGAEYVWAVWRRLHAVGRLSSVVDRNQLKPVHGRFDQSHRSYVQECAGGHDAK